LVVQGSPTEGEQMRVARAARLASPEAVAARKASRTEFEHLGPRRRFMSCGTPSRAW
jgi:hypothetical protein